MDKDEYLNSTDIEERISELDDLIESGEATDEEKMEHGELLALQEEASSSPDWNHGEQLIRADKFVEYTEQLIDDCYPMPKGFNAGDWPYRHMKFDIEAAADELAQDYMEVNFGDTVYLIRA